MSLPKLDTISEQQKKRFDRSKPELLSMLDILDQIEFDLSMFSDYLDEDDLMEAKDNLGAAYSLIRCVTDKRTTL